SCMPTSSNFMTTNTTMATTKALRSNKCPSKANISLKMAFPQTNNQQPSPSLPYRYFSHADGREPVRGSSTNAPKRTALPFTVRGELGQAFVPILPIKAAVYKGLFAEDGRPWMGLPFQCSTGNCTFPPIETLGVCHKCVDMSEYMTRYCPPGVSDQDNCGWQLPSGAAKLNSSDHVFGMTSLFPGSATGDATYSTIMKLIFMGTETNATGPGVLAPWATQCSLTVCLQTLTSNITNGFLHETHLGEPITNDTSPLFCPPSPAASTPLEPLTIQSPTNSSLTYSMSMQSILAMQSWFSRLFANGTASRNPNYINQTISKFTFSKTPPPTFVGKT
ncbi:hypothetical protein B0T13DRAFT_484701, partial [Neurospora crassa]